MFVCANCKNKIDLTLTCCNYCKFEFKYINKKFIYCHDKLLFYNFKDKYLLNKVLNNNGYISYKFLQDGSLSLSDRDDVKRFKNYLLKQITLRKECKILDVGCGLLEVPGYLNFKSTNIEFYGLEPLAESKFFGNLIIGCSEYIPLKDNSIDFILFATSLDHVCSINATLKEVYRVLKSNGKVIIWMGDQSKTFLDKMKNKIRIFRDNIKKGYRTDLYYVYPNLTVLQVPRGGVDPFHSFFESPQVIKKMFIENNFEFNNMDYHSKNQVFLTFTKSIDR
jgi:SAM-dependent methyltransferase